MGSGLGFAKKVFQAKTPAISNKIDMLVNASQFLRAFAQRRAQRITTFDDAAMRRIGTARHDPAKIRSHACSNGVDVTGVERLAETPEKVLQFGRKSVAHAEAVPQAARISSGNGTDFLACMSYHTSVA